MNISEISSSNLSAWLKLMQNSENNTGANFGDVLINLMSESTEEESSEENTELSDLELKEIQAKQSLYESIQLQNSLNSSLNEDDNLYINTLISNSLFNNLSDDNKENLGLEYQIKLRSASLGQL